MSEWESEDGWNSLGQRSASTGKRECDVVNSSIRAIFEFMN